MSMKEHPGLSLTEALTRGGMVQAGGRGRAVQAATRDPVQAMPELTRILLPSALPQWRSRRVAYYTPQQVEFVLSNALSGDLQGQWELFDLMEDTWPRLAKNLGEIKRAVASLRWTVLPWAEDDTPPTPDADMRAKLVSHVIWRMKPEPGTDERDFNGLVYDLLDAWGKGLSVVELVWEERQSGRFAQHLALRSAQWVAPVNYALDTDGRLGLRTGNVAVPGISSVPTEVEPFESYPYKFLIGVAKGRTNHFATAGLLRPLAWWWAATNFSADWLLNYAQLFGVPMRWATYSTGSSETTITRIGEALTGMGSSGWATFPEGTSLSLHEGSKTAGTSPQDGVLDRADKYCDLLILGQTLTSDAADRGTQALGTVHERVRGDVMQSAADWVAGVLTQQLAPMILELNFGDAEMTPEFQSEPERQKDELANAQRDQVLFAAGVQMPKKWFYERHDIPLPREGEETVGGGTMDPMGYRFGAPDGPGADAEAQKGLKMPQDAPEAAGGDKTPAEAGKCAAQNPLATAAHSGANGDRARSVSAARTAPASDPAERVAARNAPALAKAYQGAMAPFREAIMASKSAEEAIRRVQELYVDWSPDRVAMLVEEALQIDAAMGSVDGKA